LINSCFSSLRAIGSQLPHHIAQALAAERDRDAFDEVGLPAARGAPRLAVVEEQLADGVMRQAVGVMAYGDQFTE
jgi:hypothetical protein